MGGGVSREPEVHVVVVQSQENGKVDAKVLRETYTSIRKGDGKKTGKGFEESTHEERIHSDTELYEHHKSQRSLPKNLSLSSVSKSRARGRIKEEEEGDNQQQTTFLSTGEGRLRYRSRHLSDTSTSNYQSTYDTASPGSSRGGDMTGLRRASADTPEVYHHRSHDDHRRHHNGQSHSTGRHYHNHHHHGNKLTSNSSVTMETVHGSGEANEQVQGNMFEMFRTYDGEEYTVYVREDGKRFYVDFEEQKWRFFPDTWAERGSFLPVDYSAYQYTENDTTREGQFTDVREGEFIHPTRGKMITYLQQESINVLYFFDETSGSWLPMPLSWERHVPGVSRMITEIQKSCPGWKDAKSIVAMLRCCKYNQDDCISIYNSISDDGVLDYADHGPGKDPFRNLTEKKLKETTSQLKESKEVHKGLKDELEQLQSKVEELEMENTRMRKEIESGKEEKRRQSRVLRQQSISVNSQLIKPEVIKPLLNIISEDTRALRAKVTALRNVTLKGLKVYGSNLEQFSKALSQLIRIHRRQRLEIVEVRLLYRKEALQRKLLYNEVQELRGNIRVFCRCRYDSTGPCALRFDDEERVTCTTVQGRRKVFEFEKIYAPDTTQEKVFDDTKPIITSCVDGYNVCIIAYGQTGAGKTYTMMGPPQAPGVNVRSMHELFSLCKERKRVRYTMQVSMVEVYNEAVYDLLAPLDEGHEKLQLQKRGKDVIIPGLLEIEVRNMDDVMMLFNEGEKNRKVACTKMNTNSSRSHLLFMLKVEGFDVVSKATSRGRLTLVDLAGSERISRSEATGIRLVEAAAINKSLSALGQVFASIRNSALHIPYRNSKLTHILQPCIGGDSKTCMFVNISPLQDNMAETVSTLEFGQNARQVELGKATKHVTRLN